MILTNNHKLNLSRFGVAVCLLFWAFNGAEAQVPVLYRETNQRGALKAQSQDPTVVRSKNIIIDVRQVRNKQSKRIAMPTFDGKSLVLNLLTLEPQKGGLVWKGKIANQPGSSASFVVVGNVVIGNIRTTNGNSYQIRYLGNGVHSFREIDQSRFPNEAEPGEPPLQILQRGKPGEPQELAAAAPPTCTTDPATVIDALVVFTAATRAAAGGLQALQAEIILAIQETNDSYNNSRITQRVRLAHMEEVNYSESRNSLTDKNRLQRPTDGFMDNVHTLRNTFAADVVVLIVENLQAANPPDPAQICGEAFIMDPVTNAFEKFAFAVVRRDCSTGNFTFGHELGHVMSARHDWAADSANNSPFVFNHGFVETTPTSPARPWRTIMGVNQKANPTGRIQFWSNPNVDDPAGGDPTGVSTGNRQANNARTLNTTALTVANFRCGLVDKNKIWTTVGSDGKVDENDTGKVFFDRSIAQMGRLVGGSTPTSRRRALITQTQSAVIRYNVTPTDTLFRVSGGIELKLNYLATGGSAKVIAKLITVDLATGSETVSATFDSSAFPSSNNYQVQSVARCGTTIDTPLDFELNAYYIEVTLSIPAIAINSAAGVRMIKLSKTDCEP